MGFIDSRVLKVKSTQETMAMTFHCDKQHSRKEVAPIKSFGVTLTLHVIIEFSVVSLESSNFHSQDKSIVFIIQRRAKLF